jgi:hypothetical protein
MTIIEVQDSVQNIVIEVQEVVNSLDFEFVQEDNTVTLQPVITRSSGAVGVINEQNFTATDGQTVFTVTGSPTSLKMVFKGRTLALEGVGLDYEYSGGTLTFNTGLIENTKVKVIF